MSEMSRGAAATSGCVPRAGTGLQHSAALRRTTAVLGASLLGLCAASVTTTVQAVAVDRGPASSEALSAAEPAAARERIVSAYGELPLRFEPNVGQAAPEAQYLARGEGYDIFLSASGPVLSLRGNAPGQAHAPVPPAALRLRLVHASPSPRLHAERPQASLSNYFIGNDRSAWHRDVANYGAVRYEQVYPGIDWLVYGNPQQLEYDLVVAAQADPRRIRLKFEGAGRLVLDQHGDLLLRVHGQTLRQLKPVLYQVSDEGERRRVDGHYLLDHQQLAFAVGRYDHGRPLVIDPAFAYSTYLGGSRSTVANAIAVDSAGNAYIAGNTGATDFPTAHPYQGSNNGGNAFIAKLSADGGSLVYSTYLGGSGGENAAGIAVDSAGNAYLAGSTYSTDFPLANAYQSSNKAAGTDTNESAFLTKLSADGGSLVYSTYLGGSNDLNGAAGLALDSAGSAYLVGSTNSTDFPTAKPLQAAL
ncbi:MAG TPA: SBBP repeat-containing protein, partial [Nevskia sp.]|nr:SBBP repeat-containing protein [Nevskia sp.]